MMNQERVHQVKVIWKSFPKGSMKKTSMKCRLSWREDKGNDRKGRKHEKLGGEKKKSPQHKPPPQYDRQ